MSPSLPGGLIPGNVAVGVLAAANIFTKGYFNRIKNKTKQQQKKDPMYLKQTCRYLWLSQKRSPAAHAHIFGTEHWKLYKVEANKTSNIF